MIDKRRTRDGKYSFVTACSQKDEYLTAHVSETNSAGTEVSALERLSEEGADPDGSCERNEQCGYIRLYIFYSFPYLISVAKTYLQWYTSPIKTGG